MPRQARSQAAAASARSSHAARVASPLSFIPFGQVEDQTTRALVINLRFRWILYHCDDDVLKNVSHMERDMVCDRHMDQPPPRLLPIPYVAGERHDNYKSGYSYQSRQRMISRARCSLVRHFTCHLGLQHLPGPTVAR